MPDARRVYPSLWIAAMVAALSVAGSAQQAPPAPTPFPGGAATFPGSAPAASASPAPAGTGVIFGRVIDAGTGHALSGVLVRLSTAPGITPISTPSAAPVAPPTPALTNGQGQFLFRGLTAGGYSLSTQLGGYLPGSYGQNRVDGPASRVQLTDGQRVNDASIRMWKYGAITGRVLDEAGEPFVGLLVRALRRSVVAGQSQWTSVLGTTQTDDRGVYRVGSLQPGEYVVATTAGVATVPVSMGEEYVASMNAGAAVTTPAAFLEAGTSPMGSGTRLGDLLMQPLRNSLPPPPPASVDEVLAYQVVFHPAVTRLADATRVRVGSGEERTGIDLQSRLVKTFRISGRLTGLDGQPMSAGLSLVPTDARGLNTDRDFETGTAVSGADGRFTFLGVPTGQYTIKMFRAPRPTNVGITTTSVSIGTGAGGVVIGYSGSEGDVVPPPLPDEPTLWAEVPVTVSGHTDDVSVGARSGARVRGTLVFDGPGEIPTQRQRQQMSFSLVPVEGRAWMRPPPPGRVVGEDGFVTAQYPPGKYFVNVTQPGSPWTLRSVTVAGRNAAEVALDLGPSDIDGVVVTFTSRTTQLAGTVRGTSSGAPHAAVVIFPADHERWIASGMRATRARSVAAGVDGSFQLSGMPAGAYLVVALAPDVAVDLQDPATIATLARVGATVTLVEGETRSVPLTLSSIR